MSQENKALARRSWEAVDNPDLIDEVYAPNLVWHEPDQEVQGSEQAKQFISMYKSAFPDFFYRVEDQIAEGDKMTTRYTMGGTHQGEFFGVPGSRKRIEISGINVDRFDESGKRETMQRERLRQVANRPLGSGHHALTVLAHALNPYLPTTHKLMNSSEGQLEDVERRRVRRVMSSSCSQPSPTKE